MNNPWNLTPRQCEALAALVQHSSAKGTGIALGIVHKRACALLRSAYRRMNVGNDVQAALAWDRWARRIEYVTGEPGTGGSQ